MKVLYKYHEESMREPPFDEYLWVEEQGDDLYKVYDINGNFKGMYRWVGLSLFYKEASILEYWKTQERINHENRISMWEFRQ